MKYTSTNISLIVNKDAGLFKVKENKQGTNLLNLNHLVELRDLINDYLEQNLKQKYGEDIS